mgnify:CR=1 FL=1
MKCPTCASENVSHLNSKHPLIHHWILNPGLAFNEAVLGQRLPAQSYFCKACDAPYSKRNWAQCPACDCTFSGEVWSGRHAFGHWYGIVCPGCGERWPTLWNATSLLVLAVTSPLWILPHLRYKARIIEWGRRRARRAWKKHEENTPP